MDIYFTTLHCHERFHYCPRTIKHSWVLRLCLKIEGKIRVMERVKQTSSQTSHRTQTPSGTAIQKLNWKLYSRTYTECSGGHGFHECHLKMAKTGLFLKISAHGRFKSRALVKLPFLPDSFQIENQRHWFPAVLLNHYLCLRTVLLHHI